MKLFKLASEEGSPQAQTMLGMAYLGSILNKIIRKLLIAADQGEPGAQVELGIILCLW